MENKICNICNKSKPETDFYWIKRQNSYKLSNKCKSCRNKQNRERYLLKMSKDKKRTLELRDRGPCPENHSWCPHCNKYLPNIKFSPSRVGKSRPCINCSNQYSYQLIMEHKKKLIEKLGNKCSRCCFQGHWAAFDFHHPDPSKKELSWKNVRGSSLETTSKLLIECVLLCKNCHAIVHCSLDENGNNNPEFIKS